LGKLFRDHSQVVKVSHGIGFRPETHFAGIPERFVRGLDFLHSIEITNNFVANTFNSKFVPLPGAYREQDSSIQSFHPRLQESF